MFQFATNLRFDVMQHVLDSRQSKTGTEVYEGICGSSWRRHEYVDSDERDRVRDMGNYMDRDKGAIGEWQVRPV